MTSSEYVIGVDGGNSKTDVAIADVTGAILGRSRGEGTRAPSTGTDNVAANLAALIGAAKAQAGLVGPAEAAVFYLANADMPEEEREMEAALGPHNLAARVVVGNDTQAVLRAGTDAGWGVGVVLGAGINAIGVAPDGRVARYLSLGAMSGDWGGGMGLAIAAIGAAVRWEDGRGEATDLARTLPAHFGLDSAWNLVLAVHRHRIPSVRLHELVPVLFATADAGDAVARTLVARQAAEVATMAAALIHRLHLEDTDVPVILGGGVGQSRQPLLMSGLAAELAARAPRAVPHVLNHPPVAGAVAAALDLAGAGGSAVHRARAHDWTAR